jgi:hypothetical protein
MPARTAERPFSSSGQYSNALRVVAFNAAEGWSRDVSEDIAGEVLDRALDADENLSEDTKRFIDRHMTPGEKRPASAVGARRGADHALQVGDEKPAREVKRSSGDAGAFGVRALWGMVRTLWGLGWGHRARTP